MPYYGIGTTSGNIVPFNNATPKILPDPYPVDFSPYTTIVGESGAGAPIEMGPPKLTWAWERLQQIQFNYLLSFCSGASANVFIKQRIESGAQLTFKTFSATMWRPTRKKLMPGKLSEVEIRFTQLTQLD